jgi:hypothetical protein
MPPVGVPSVAASPPPTPPVPGASVAASTGASAEPVSATSIGASTRASTGASAVASADASAEASWLASTPPSTPGGGWHAPTSLPADVQTSEGGQPLPPVSRQPGMQRALVASQTRPEVAPPQSESMAHPQESPATQRAPPRSMRHALWFVAVHSTQVFESEAHTNGAGQSWSTRHCTHTSTFSVVSQRGTGVAQSPFAVHPVAVEQRPTPPETPPQVSFVGQPLWLGPQPGTQKPFGPLQMRPEIAVPQAASVEHPHRPVAARHSGCAPPHSVAFVAEHSVHAPASGPVFWQAGRAGSGQLGAPSAVQPTQTCVVAAQTGVVPPQSALPRQLTHTPPPPDVSHKGAPAAQRLVSVVVQTAHAPVARQTGNFGSQSALVRQMRHACVPWSQIGCVPEQSALPTHSTHVLDPVSQTLCAVAQAPGLPAAHATHEPLAPQTGVAPPHSASTAHARHVCVAPSHTGAPPAQSVDVTHETQRPSAASQSAVAPVHVVVFVVEHAPHAPDGWHAEAPAAPQSPSATHPRQTCVVPSQTGDAAVPH